MKQIKLQLSTIKFYLLLFIGVYFNPSLIKGQEINISIYCLVMAGMALVSGLIIEFTEKDKE